MAYGKSRTRLLAGAALLLAAALAAASCSSSPAAGAGGNAGTSHAATTPPVTTAQASQVFAAYVAAADRAAIAGNSSQALSVVTGVQKTTVQAQLQAGGSGAGAIARYRYGTPTFYLPQPGGYPRWFVASVQRTLAGQPASQPGQVSPGSPGSPQGTAGVPLAATGQVLMVFEQGSATSPWLLGSASQLAPGTSVPPLAVNSAGYVATVPLSSGAQLAQPQVTGALQAAVVDDGPASPAAKVVAAGNLTTGLYTAARAGVVGLTPPRGDVYQWELEGAHYSTFALRTASGGALICYAMYLVNTVEVPALANKGVVNPGRTITVPGYLNFLLPHGPGRGGPAARERVETEALLSFAAVDPPAGAGKIQVVAMGGGLIYADAS